MIQNTSDLRQARMQQIGNWSLGTTDGCQGSPMCGDLQLGSKRDLRTIKRAATTVGHVAEALHAGQSLSMVGEEHNNNTALSDEIEALNSIYGPDTVWLCTSVKSSLTAILQLPDTAYSFNLAFEPTYPENQPDIQGVHSVAKGGAIGGGRAAEELLVNTLKRIWVPGQVCLFDLIEEARIAFQRSEEEPGGIYSEDEVKSRASTAFEQEATTIRSEDDNSQTMYAALIRTHHITSRKKVATLKAAAKQIGCAALLRSGGTPGVMYVESRRLEDVKRWVETVHDLRYKDYQLVSPPGTVPGRPLVEAAEEVFDFEEVGSVKDFAARMEEKGIIEWWRRAMGYVSQ
jgi:hypothetical protein